MNLSALESMSSDALLAIRDKCVSVLESRKTATLRRGAVGWFMDRNGVKRFLYIERINAKSVSGYEVDELTRRRLNPTTWRVSPALLNIVGDSMPRAAAPAVPHRPSTTAEAVW